jgi:hypothetical protein
MVVILVIITTVAGLGYDQVGKISPQSALPVSNSITNLGFYADYTFTFSTANDIPYGGTLSITFPNQFQNNLGIAGNPGCSALFCTLSGYTVSIEFPMHIYANSVTSVTIYSIKNPGNAGGTGNFQLVSKYSGYVIDMNLVFATLGISEAPSELTLVTVGILPGSSNVAGAITMYLFTFQFDQIVPANSWIEFTFPDNGIYIPSNPTCSSYSTNGINIQGNLLCNTNGLQVILTGISQDLEPGIQYNIRMTCTNPNWSGNLGNFGINVFRENTNTLYLYKSDILGFNIVPSNFLSVVFAPVDSTLTVSQNNIMLYRLTIRLMNPVESMGYIIIKFPSTFSMNGNYLVWVESGLNDFSYTDSTRVSYNIPTLTLTITNFASVPAQTFISIIMQLQNPSLSGLSKSLSISTLRPDGVTIIDQDTNSAVINVSSLTSPTITVTYTGSAVAGGVSVIINFKIIPNIQVPAQGYIGILIPSGFSISNLVCKLTPYGSGTDFASSCSSTGSILWVQLFVSTTNSPSGPGNFQSGQTSVVILSLLSPTQSDNYYFSVGTYDTTKKLLEIGGVMVQISAPPFVSKNVFPINSAINSQTVLVFKLTCSSVIPSGLSQSNVLATRGYFQVQLPTQSSGNLLFGLDLGLGLIQGDEISCRGINVISGNDIPQLKCIITSRPTIASVGTPVIITISEFLQIPANTAFEFHIAGLYYLQSINTATVSITAYSVKNRIQTNIHSDTFVLVSASNAPISTSFTSPVVLSASQVQSLTSLAFTFTSAAVSSTNSYLLLIINPTHDNGYCTNLALYCSTGTIYTCYCYPGADIISIILPTGLAAGSYTFTIQGLTNPQSVPSISDALNLYIIQNLAAIKYYNAGNIPALSPGTIKNIAINFDQTCANCVNVNYEFYLRCPHYVPPGGSILVTLSSTNSYSLHYSTPKPYCSYFSSNGVEITKYICTPYKNLITLSSLPYIPSGQLIRFILTGVKNPNKIGSLGIITFQSMNSYSRIIDSGQANSPSLLTALVVQPVNDAAVTNFPTNAGALAEYIIFFTPIASIGPGATIEIDFPTKNFNSFVNPPDCRISIGILYITDCNFNGKTFIATVNSQYHNSQVTISVLSILNFEEGTSDSFAIRVIYDGVILQQSSSPITVSTTSAAQTITTTLINYFPKNEGEIATYQFYILPSQDIDTSSYLTIIFPRSYDKRVGDTIDCWATGLTGYIKCNIVNSWTLRVSENNYFQACYSCQIVLTIYGIINPNYETTTNTGNFIVGVYQNSMYEQLNQNSGELNIEPAPGFLDLYSTEVDNYYSRTNNIFTFDFLTSVSIPSISKNGAVWIEFDKNYLLQGSDITCSSSLVWASGSPNCIIQYTLVQVFPSFQDYAGELVITVDGISNPFFQGTAGFINLKVFDGFNQVILVRSYPNLSKNQISYSFPGPQIHINNDASFNAEIGTISSYISITFDYPCALNLELIPYTFGFVFIPTVIKLNTGTMVEYFRVSVPATVDDTEYVINWQIIGDATPSYYTPINKSLFVVKKLGNIQISFSTIPKIPKGGRSIPIKIQLEYSPYKDISLLLSLSAIFSGLSILPTKMQFLPGTTTGYYQIYVSNITEASQSQVSFTLLGSNSNQYSLTQSSLSFEIYTNDIILPDVTSIAITQIFRSEASAILTTNKVCTVYYAYALYGTITPSNTELKQGGPPSYDTSNIQYGTVYIDTSYSANITFSGLSAQTYYTVFAIAEDQSLQISLIPRTANFNTLPIYPPAVINLWFSQTYLTEVEKSIVESTVALVLGLNSWQVVESSSSRRLSSASDVVITLLQLNLIDNPQSDYYPKPVDMIPLLQNQISYLNKSLDNFNSSAGVTGQEVVLSQCSFYVYPYLLGTSDYNTISISASLAQGGYLYGIAVPSEIDTGTPFAYQVYNGLDAANRVANSDSTQMSLKTESNLTFMNLIANSNYNLYVACGNLIPGFPQLNSTVIEITWKTDLQPAPTLLKISESLSIILSCLILLIY